MDLKTLTPNIPQEVMDEEGSMLGYVEVFPWSEAFRFIHNAQEWFVDDQYCVRPGCTCRPAGLSFCRAAAKADPAAEPSGVSTFLRFDYSTGIFVTETVQPGCPPPAVLVRALRAANPELLKTLRLRRSQLRRLTQRLIPKRRRRSKRAPSDPKVDALVIDESPPAAPAAAAPLPPKVGRNEPCPCGSGKKFKRCCGAAGLCLAAGPGIRARNRVPSSECNRRRGREANRAPSVPCAPVVGHGRRPVRRRSENGGGSS